MKFSTTKMYITPPKNSKSNSTELNVADSLHYITNYLILSTFKEYFSLQKFLSEIARPYL